VEDDDDNSVRIGPREGAALTRGAHRGAAGDSGDRDHGDPASAGTQIVFTADTPPATGTVGEAYGPYTFEATNSTPACPMNYEVYWEQPTGTFPHPLPPGSPLRLS